MSILVQHEPPYRPLMPDETPWPRSSSDKAAATSSTAVVPPCFFIFTLKHRARATSGKVEGLGFGV